MFSSIRPISGWSSHLHRPVGRLIFSSRIGFPVKHGIRCCHFRGRRFFLLLLLFIRLLLLLFIRFPLGARCRSLFLFLFLLFVISAFFIFQGVFRLLSHFGGFMCMCGMCDAACVSSPSPFRLDQARSARRRNFRHLKWR